MSKKIVIKVILKSYKRSYLEKYINLVQKKIGNNKNILMKGPIIMPTKNIISPLIRSSHVYKSSTTHIERKIYTKVLIIHLTGSINALSSLSDSIPSLLSIQILIKK